MPAEERAGKWEAAADALDQRDEWRQEKTRLADALALVKKRCSVSVRFSDSAERFLTFSRDDVSLDLGKVRLRSALGHLLRGTDLDWTIDQDGAVAIVMDDEVEDYMLVRAYDVSDLVSEKRRWLGAAEWTANQLVDAIRLTVTRDEWDWNGEGNGAHLLAFRTTLVARHRWQGHAQIERVLSVLRKGADWEASPSGGSPPVTAIQLDPPDKEMVRRLKERVTYKLDDVALSAIAGELLERHGLKSVIDRQALDGVGVSSESTVSINARNIPLGDALSLMLAELELIWIIRDEAVLITTPEKAESEPEPRIYPVADLIGAPWLGDASYDYDSLSDMIYVTVAPEAWGDGNSFQVQGFRGMLLVEQTATIHPEIERLLAGFRQVRDRPPGEDGRRDVSPYWLDSPSDRLVREALGRPVSLEAKGMTLSDAAERLAESVAMTIYVDERALEGIGLGGDVPVTAALDEVPLDKALDEIASQHGLAVAIRHGAAMITTPSEADAAMPIRLYPIGDLLPSQDDPLPFFAYGRPGGRSPFLEAADALIELVERTTGVDSSHGLGNAEFFPAPTVLVVTQHEAVQRQVEQLLAEIRGNLPATDETATAGDGPGNDRGETVLRVYRLVLDRDSRPAVNTRRLARVIKKIIEPESWKEMRSGIETIETALIVRCRLDIHIRVEELLLEMDVLSLRPPGSRAFEPIGDPGSGELGGGELGGFPLIEEPRD